MQGPEKNSYKEFDNEKKIPAARKSPPPPPITFLMVRPLPTFLQQMAVLYNWWRQKLWAFLSWLSTERPAAIYPSKAVYMALGSFYC